MKWLSVTDDKNCSQHLLRHIFSKVLWAQPSCGLICVCVTTGDGEQLIPLPVGQTFTPPGYQRIGCRYNHSSPCPGGAELLPAICQHNLGLLFLFWSFILFSFSKWNTYLSGKKVMCYVWNVLLILLTSTFKIFQLHEVEGSDPPC